MKKIYRNSGIVALLFLATLTQAQVVSPVDFMRMNPYQMNANPATELPYVSVMSLLVGNIGLNVQNTTLHYNNLFDFDAQGRPEVVNLRKLANSLSPNNNYLGLNANVDLFTYYTGLKKGFLTVDYRIKVEGDAKYNDGLFKLLAYGNSAFVGDNNPACISMDMNALAYQELAVGYQWKVNERLSLGGRAKLLLGTANVNTQAMDAKLYTDADTLRTSAGGKCSHAHGHA